MIKMNNDALFIQVMTKIGATRLNDNEYELVRPVELGRIDIRFVFKRNAFRRNAFRRTHLNYEGREWVLASAFVSENREVKQYTIHGSVTKQRFNFPGRYTKGSANSFAPTRTAVALIKEKLLGFISTNYHALLPDATSRAKKAMENDIQKGSIKNRFPNCTKVEVYGNSFEIYFDWGCISLMKGSGCITNICLGSEGLSIHEVVDRLLKAEVLRVDDEIRRTRLLRMVDPTQIKEG